MNKIIFISILSSFLLLTACSSGERLTSEERLEQKRQAHIDTILKEDLSGITERLPEMIGGQEALYQTLYYPNNARQNNIQVTVMLLITVNEYGIPEEIEIARSAHRDLDQAAVTTMNQMLFIPAVKNGERVSAQVPQPVIFRLAN